MDILKPFAVCQTTHMVCIVCTGNPTKRKSTNVMTPSIYEHQYSGIFVMYGINENYNILLLRFNRKKYNIDGATNGRSMYKCVCVYVCEMWRFAHLQIGTDWNHH